jgi:stage II sporulation protein D
VRRRWVIPAALCALLPAAPAGAATKLVLTGHGWGHGVGMSQWGAYGYARHGWRWQRILAHYYPGTQLADAPVSRVRVLLAEQRSAVRIACAGAMHLGDATGRGFTLPAGTYRVGAKLSLPVGHKRVKVQAGTHHRERFVVVPAMRRLRAPAAFDCPTAPLLLDGRAYHGTLVVRRALGKLSAINTLPLDEYVAGVVAGEMPHRWSIAALAAQAVASRSYALATLKPGRDFDLYADTRSQVYGGIAYETPRSNAAVAKTAGRVLEWHGRVATTFFFSTSGGRTADVREVWPALGDLPYLRSVDDPYDVSSPHHLWGPVTLDARRVAWRLHVPPGDVTVVRSASGRVRAVRIGSRSVDADDFRQELGLSSTWFDVGELSLVRSRAAVVYGGKVRLALRARGLGRATLQRRIGAGAWKTLASVHGTRAVSVEPRAATLYRLRAGDVTGPVLPVQVAPRLRVEPAGVRVLAGAVRPVVRNAVTVRRRVGSGWRVVAHPQVDPRGRFSTQLRLRPGDYRVSIAGDSRFASASASLRVTLRLLATLR